MPPTSTTNPSTSTGTCPETAAVRSARDSGGRSASTTATVSPGTATATAMRLATIDFVILGTSASGGVVGGGRRYRSVRNDTAVVDWADLMLRSAVRSRV